MKQAVLRFFAASMLAAAAAGCTVPRQVYNRSQLAPGEIYLARNDRGSSFVHQHSKGREALDLELLEKAVACVPDARAEMDAVDTLRTTGTVMRWIGWGAFIAGAAVMAASVVKNDYRYVGLAVSVGGSGALLTETPRYLAPYMFVNAVDAMNAYNDQFRSTPGCGGYIPSRAAPPKPQDDLPPGAGPKEGDPGPGGPRF